MENERQPSNEDMLTIVKIGFVLLSILFAVILWFFSFGVAACILFGMNVSYVFADVFILSLPIFALIVTSITDSDD